MTPKKPGVLALMAGTPASAPPAGQENDELGIAAAQEFLVSVQKGNAQGIWESFKAMKEACYSDVATEE